MTPARTDLHDPVIIRMSVALLAFMIGVAVVTLAFTAPPEITPMAERYTGPTPQLVLLAVGGTVAALTKLVAVIR